MSTPSPANQPAPATMGHKVLICFGTFAVFFVFYVGAALLQTPTGKSLGMIPFCGMPLGLAMSLAIFPLSWLLIIFWFWKAK